MISKNMLNLNSLHEKQQQALLDSERSVIINVGYSSKYKEKSPRLFAVLSVKPGIQIFSCHSRITERNNQSVARSSLLFSFRKYEGSTKCFSVLPLPISEMDSTLNRHEIVGEDQAFAYSTFGDQISDVKRKSENGEHSLCLSCKCRLATWKIK